MTPRGTQPKVHGSCWLCTTTGLLVALLFIPSHKVVADVVIDLTYIGDPGEGGVDYVYSIGTYEVTVAQYAEFLNAVAASDPYGLYYEAMGSGGSYSSPCITQNGTDGSYTYAVVSGTEDQPIRFVSFYDAARFCNWLSNGQGNGDTEYGSYDLSEGVSMLRLTNATWVIPTEEEWIKAGYYDAETDTFSLYPNGSDEVPAEPTDETSAREFNFGDDPYWNGTECYTATGETTAVSPYGTYDQGGNVAELTETMAGLNRRVKGGSFLSGEEYLQRGNSLYISCSDMGDNIGFRIAYIIPEPSTIVLFFVGSLGAIIHRRRAR